ncbi:unnamed protein product [Acanthosepion pharaonis]|uniref:Uncharacterized protein n=1 Tax=Acanthosepion pharaonis TaxID=158019 RepID=A0A812D591_ACAPH|nr:unnamed protein product [Sepia pharaonis]
MSPLLQLVFEKEKKEIKQVSKPVDILDYLLDSKNFDIDLLQSFHEKKVYSPQADPSGEKFYRQLCERAKLPPVGYICEHLKDRNFVMQQHYLSKEKLMLLIEALKQNTTIEILDLSDNNICSENIVSLFVFLAAQNLSHNNIQMEGVSAVSILLDVTPTLTSLFLARNSLENEDITPLVLTLKSNFFLTTLDLSYNKISSEGGHYLGSCLAMNETLHILDLHWCQINGKGAMELAKGLRQNPSLKVLDISWNGFAEDSCWSLALSLMGVRVSERIFQQMFEMQHLPTKTVLQNDASDMHSHLDKLCYIYLSRLERFVLEHKVALRSLFEKTDKDNQEYLGKEHMRFCLEKTGFYLTLRHMAVLLGKLRKNNLNLIAYKPLFDGSISKMVKAEELKRKYNATPTRPYFMFPKSAWS